jgi:hypothetical protein
MNQVIDRDSLRTAEHEPIQLIRPHPVHRVDPLAVISTVSRMGSAARQRRGKLTECLRGHDRFEIRDQPPTDGTFDVSAFRIIVGRAQSKLNSGVTVSKSVFGNDMHDLDPTLSAASKKRRFHEFQNENEGTVQVRP